MNRKCQKKLKSSDLFIEECTYTYEHMKLTNERNSLKWYQN